MTNQAPSSIFPPTASARRVIGVSSIAFAIACAQPAAAGVRAGTVISNTASATYTNGGTATTTVASNTVSLRVDEILDVAVTPRETSEVGVTAGATGQVLGFTVTNTGNGEESFALSVLAGVAGNDFDPAVTAVAIDGNGNGQYEPGIDVLVPAGGVTPLLAPDGSVTVFVVSTIPQDALDAKHGRLRLTATAETGSGTPGTMFAGKGFGGGDAIVGATNALQSATSGFVVSRAGVTFVKSATVADVFGGTRALPGSIITWRLVATVDGSGTVSGLTANDPIPTGTTYQPGTLTLDGAALSDATDGDAGAASGSGIVVQLGTQAAGSSRAIEFKTKIN